jgi:hypothetical protein
MKTLLHLLLFFIPTLAFSQFYPYSDDIYHNIERNPTFVLTPDHKTAAFFSHNGSLPGNNNFYSDQVRLQHYYESFFSGLGVFFTHTGFNDSTRYNCIGISAAYRNVIFDKAYIKIGLTYKFLQNRSVSGIYNDYTISPIDSITKRNDISNFNTSFTVSSPSDFYFFSVGVCNINPLTIYNQNKNPFLLQYHTSIGNIFSLFNMQLHNYLSFTYLENHYQNSKFHSRGYFLTLWSMLLRVTRKTSIIGGFSGGYYEKKYYQVSPFLQYVRKTFAVKIGSDFFISQFHYKNSYKFLPQFSLIKTL